MVLTVVAQVWGAMSWLTGLPRASDIRAWAHLGPILGPSWPFVGASWGQIGPKLGRLGRILGHVGATWGPSWRARGGIPRQTPDFEAPSSSLRVAMRPHAKNLKKPSKNQCFSMIFVGTGLRGSVLSWFVRGKGVSMQRDKGYCRKEIDLSTKPKQFHNPNGFCQPILLFKSWSTVSFVR